MIDFVNPYQPGQWIQWSTPHQVKRGEVLISKGCSIVVRWLGGEEQVFPNVESYIDTHRALDDRMEIIERPKEASRVAKESRQGVMGVVHAAAVLGTTPKRIRALLRSGQLKGTQEGGKWITVDVTSVKSLSS